MSISLSNNGRISKFLLAYSAGDVQYNYKQIVHQIYMPQYCEGVNNCIYIRVAECNRIIRQMRVQNWGICRTSSINAVVMQMKSKMGGQKNATVKNLRNSTKVEKSKMAATSTIAYNKVDPKCQKYGI